MTDSPARPSRWLARGLRCLPSNVVSRLAGRLARSRASRPLIMPFARAFQIVLHEAERDVLSYDTLNEFFTRRLRPDARPVDRAKGVIVSPVDGRVSAHGCCAAGRMLQVKGHDFDLLDLLLDPEMAEVFQDGTFLTIYLSPHDYHRVHAPLDLDVFRVRHLKGALLPVNRPSVRFIPELYTHNERVAVFADSPLGRLAVILVGAHCVGSISLSFCDLITNQPRRADARIDFDQAHLLRQGEELGMFELGSTVILLFEKGQVELAELSSGDHVLMGQRIAAQAQASKSRKLRKKRSSPGP